MQPLDRGPRRRNMRHAKHSEPEYYPDARRTRRQRGQDLAQETEDMLARQAHIDAGQDLADLLADVPGVTVIYLPGGTDQP